MFISTRNVHVFNIKIITIPTWNKLKITIFALNRISMNLVAFPMFSKHIFFFILSTSIKHSLWKSHIYYSVEILDHGLFMSYKSAAEFYKISFHLKTACAVEYYFMHTVWRAGWVKPRTSQSTRHCQTSRVYFSRNGCK